MLTHISQNKISILSLTAQKIHSPKPYGLWYAYDYEWLDYQAKEECFLTGYMYELSIKKKYILRLKSYKNIKQFIAKFQIVDGNRPVGIDWAKVQVHYAGVEMTQWQSDWWRRLGAEEQRLYDIIYLWCLRSGCIWDPIAIKRMKFLRELY